MSGKEHDDGLDASFIISQAKSRNRPLHPYTPEKEEDNAAPKIFPVTVPWSKSICFIFIILS